MTKRVILLHTVAGLAGSFGDLAREILPAGVEVWHIVDEMLAKIAVAEGELTPFIYRRVADHAAAAEQAGAALLQFTCSSISPCADAVRPLVGIPVLKIDEAMVDRALAMGRRIAVAATAQTALRPVAALARERAREHGVQAEVESALCTGAYEALFSGRPEEHDRIVAETLTTLMARNDVILLAQASMARVVEALPEGERRIPILTSPRLGLERARDVLAGLP